MTIHFVCTANMYRSRLAEAYLRSKKIPGLFVSSSGIAADVHARQQVSWYTEHLLTEAGILSFESRVCTEVTAEILATQDLVIFMEPEHLTYAQKNFGFTGTNFEVWNVPDVTCGTEVPPEIITPEEIACRNLTEVTMQTIREKVDDLVKRLELQK